MLLGYIEFVALLFIPGIAFMELFRLGDDFSFVERLGLAFGLSMAIDVLVLAFRTSGILIGSQFMIGIGPRYPRGNARRFRLGIRHACSGQAKIELLCEANPR